MRSLKLFNCAARARARYFPPSSPPHRISGGKGFRACFLCARQAERAASQTVLTGLVLTSSARRSRDDRRVTKKRAFTRHDTSSVVEYRRRCCWRRDTIFAACTLVRTEVRKVLPSGNSSSCRITSLKSVLQKKRAPFSVANSPRRRGASHSIIATIPT